MTQKAHTKNVHLEGTMEIDEKGMLSIGGQDVRELVSSFGTPLLVMDEDKIRENIREYIKSLSKIYPDSKVAYAGKALLNKAICKIIAAEGGFLDVVSGGELYTALQAGFPPEKIFFHGNNKLNSEIKRGLNNDIGRFVIDNFQEAERLAELACTLDKKVRALVRITPGIQAHTHDYIQTGQLDSKFGIPLKDDRALKLIKKITKSKNIVFRGLHAHIGSQIFNLESYEKLIAILMEFAGKLNSKNGVIIKELNLGGGLAIAHLESEEAPDIAKFVEKIAAKVTEMCKKWDYSPPELILEPGRSIVGNAGTTLYRAGSIKKNPDGKNYVAVDGGMTDNIRPALYDARYTAFAAEKCFSPLQQKISLAGKCCETGDILIDEIDFPEVDPGDIIAVPSTGAYTFPMSSNYNKIPHIAVILVKNGQAREIVKRQSYDDMLSNEVIPEDLK